MNRNKIILLNISLAIVLAVLWAAFLSHAFTLKNCYAYLLFISLVAAPVDLLAGLIVLAAGKKTWASALLWSAAIFAFLLLFGFATAKIF